MKESGELTLDGLVTSHVNRNSFEDCGPRGKLSKLMIFILAQVLVRAYKDWETGTELSLWSTGAHIFYQCAVCIEEY